MAKNYELTLSTLYTTVSNPAFCAVAFSIVNTKISSLLIGKTVKSTKALLSNGCGFKRNARRTTFAPSEKEIL